MLVGFSLLVTFYYQFPESNQFELYTSDATLFFSSTKIGEIKNSVVLDLLNNSVVYEDEFIGESFTRFCKNNDLTNYNRLIGSTLGEIIPVQFNYQASVLHLDQSTCLTMHNGDLSSYNSSSLRSSSRVVILGRDSTLEPLGPFIFEVTVW